MNAAVKEPKEWATSSAWTEHKHKYNTMASGKTVIICSLETSETHVESQERQASQMSEANKHCSITLNTDGNI